MYLLLITLVLLFSKSNGCFGAGGGGTPEIPLCQTCGDLPVLAAPAGGTTVDNPGGTVTTSLVTDPDTMVMCKSYTLTCPAAGASATTGGANQAATPLTEFGTPGEKTATLSCNDAGEIEGTNTQTMETVMVTDVYCSRT